LGPFGDFVIQQTTVSKVFIATGTGISPIYSMMRSAWDVDKELHFGVRTQKDLFYLEELAHIPRLNVHIYLSHEEVEGYTF